MFGSDNQFKASNLVKANRMYMKSDEFNGKNYY